MSPPPFKTNTNSQPDSSSHVGVRAMHGVCPYNERKVKRSMQRIYPPPYPPPPPTHTHHIHPNTLERDEARVVNERVVNNEHPHMSVYREEARSRLRDHLRRPQSPAFSHTAARGRKGGWKRQGGTQALSVTNPLHLVLSAALGVCFCGTEKLEIVQCGLSWYLFCAGSVHHLWERIVGRASEGCMIREYIFYPAGKKMCAAPEIT